jgi:hypothetical protein
MKAHFFPFTSLAFLAIVTSISACSGTVTPIAVAADATVSDVGVPDSGIAAMPKPDATSVPDDGMPCKVSCDVGDSLQTNCKPQISDAPQPCGVPCPPDATCYMRSICNSTIHCIKKLM